MLQPAVTTLVRGASSSVRVDQRHRREVGKGELSCSEVVQVPGITVPLVNLDARHGALDGLVVPKQLRGAEQHRVRRLDLIHAVRAQESAISEPPHKCP